MPKTIVVVGYGPGVSTPVAEKFGAEGFAAALVGRNAGRAGAGVEALEAKRIEAAACPADAGDPSAIAAAIGEAQVALGPIGAVHWNAYSGGTAGDLAQAARRRCAPSSTWLSPGSWRRRSPPWLTSRGRATGRSSSPTAHTAS